MNKRNMKKIIALSLVCALTLTLVNVSGVSAQTPSETDSTVKTEAKKVSFNDYETANVNPGYYEDGKPISAAFDTLSGDLSPKALEDEHKNVLWYRQFYYGLGIAYLGFDYGSQTLSNFIEVEPGVTYQIEYEYKVFGEVKNNSLDIGVAAGMASRNDKAQDKYFENTSYYEVVDSYPIGTVDTGWQKKSVRFVVSSDENLNGKNILQLFAKGGSSDVEVYFDNITVTKTAEYTTKVLFDSDYEEVADDKLIPMVDYGPAWMQWGAGLGDTSVLEAETTGSHGKVLLYKQNATARGQFILGYDYNTGDTSNFVRVEAGKSYRVTFDYKVQGAIGGSDLTFGLAAGDQFNYDAGNGQSEQFHWELVSDYDKQVSKRTVIKTLSANTTVDQEWQTITAEIYFPMGQDFTNGNLLMIYAMDGSMQESPSDNTRGLYFDNVRVEEVLSVAASSAVLKDTVVYQEDFSKITDICEVHSDKYGSFSNDVYPTEIEDNKALGYKQSHHALGVIQLGFDYSSDNLGSQYITPTAATAYEITFRYKIVAEAGATSDLIMGVAVGDTDIGNADGYGYGDYKQYYDAEHTSAHEVFLTTPTTEVQTRDWAETTFVYTVPDDCDTENRSLQLYVIGAGGATIYFDDISVTELAGVYVISDIAGTHFYADGNLSYQPMTENGYSIRWYKDKSHNNAFFVSDYSRTGEISSLQLYGTRDYSNQAIIKGDVDLDGNVDQSDVSSMRGVILGNVEENIKRCDANQDGKTSVTDIVRIKKISGGVNMSTKMLIGKTAVSGYKIVNHIPSKVVEDRVWAIKNITGITDNGTKTITVSLDESLTENSYVFKLDSQDNLIVKGQSIDAVTAGMEMLLGFIRAGVSIDETDNLEFVYTGTPYHVLENAVLVLSDEFDGEVEKTDGEGKRELLAQKGFQFSYLNEQGATYALTDNNLSFKDGKMILGVSNETTESGNPYQGTEVRTQERYSYGYYEIRAKLDVNQGICPAFWLIQDDPETPKAGDWVNEIDIFECFGKYPSYVKGSLLNHTYYKKNFWDTSLSKRVVFSFHYDSTQPEFEYENAAVDGTDATFRQTYFNFDNPEEYHIFGLDWREDSVTWYIDGVAYMTAKIPQTVTHTTGDKYTCDWNNPMAVVLTCYAGNDVGGKTGTPDETTDWENNSMEVDYIRVYQYQ